MHTDNSHRATDWSRERPRTLLAKDRAVWLWPGIPLAMEQNGTVQPLPGEWVRPWITALHGFEARHSRLNVALVRTAEHLTAGDEDQAQNALDLAGIERLSQEGAVLADAVAAELGISLLDMAVGTRSLPWGGLDHVDQFARFRRFGGAAHQFEKAGNPDQPRWPKDAPDSQGGEYARANAAVGSAEAEIKDPRLGMGGNGGPPLEPGIGHNGGPPLDDLPDIPEEEPPTAQLRNTVIRNIAVWALRRGLTALIPGVGEAIAITQLGIWVYQYLPYINAYLQPPQTLEELQNAVNDPQPGYQIHHNVEQTPARKEGYSEDQIESPENLVRISTFRHWQISNWYSRANDNSKFGGLSPRDYLRGKSWQEKVQVGRQALIKFGVLKP